MAIANEHQLRTSRMLSSAPSRKTIKIWARQQVGDVYNRPRQDRRGHAHAFPADLVVDWVSASSYIKDVKQTEEAAECFAKLFARSGPASQ
eukprot:3978425-Pyramimonas_sp.AAC.1